MLTLLALIFTLSSCTLKTRLKPSESPTEFEIGSNNINAFCFVNLDGVAYDLGKLYDETSDYYIKNNQDYFYFNFCKFAHYQCKKDRSFVVYKPHDSPDDCHLLTAPNNKTSPQWKITKESSNNNMSSIEIDFPLGESCSNGITSGYYNTKYVIKCDQSVPNVMFDNPKEISINNCENTIQMRSQYACPDYKRYSLSNTMKSNKVIIGLVLLFTGIYFCFLSYRFLKATRIITGIIIMNLITFIIASSCLNVFFSTLNFYIMLGLSSVVGIALGYVLMKFPYVVSPLLGGLMGFVLTEIIFNLFAGLIKSNPKMVYFIILGSFVALGVIFGAVFQRHVFVIGSGLGGAYAILRGFGLLQNNFPVESQIYDLVNRKEWIQLYQLLDYKFYLYLVFIVIFGTCGIVFQYMRFFKKTKEGDREFNKTN